MKYNSSVYLKDVTKYEYKIHVDLSLDQAVSVKKVLKIKEPFILNEDGTNIKILDDGYSIVEVINFDEDYICRAFFDDKDNLIEKFFTAIKNGRIVDGVACYDDLKFSFVVSKVSKKFYNKEGLIDLLERKKITKEECEKAEKTVKNMKLKFEENSDFDDKLKKYLNKGE